MFLRLAALWSSYQLSPTALFNALMVTSGTMTHRIDQLEQAGQAYPRSERSPRHTFADRRFDLIEKRLQLMLPMNTHPQCFEEVRT